MTFSIIFNMAGRIKIGLWLFGMFLSSDLKVGYTSAFFQSSGNIPALEVCFRSLLEILSNLQFTEGLSLVHDQAVNV